MSLLMFHVVGYLQAEAWRSKDSWWPTYWPRKASLPFLMMQVHYPFELLSDGSLSVERDKMRTELSAACTERQRLERLVDRESDEMIERIAPPLCASPLLLMRIRIYPAAIHSGSARNYKNGRWGMEVCTTKRKRWGGGDEDCTRI